MSHRRNELKKQIMEAKERLLKFSRERERERERESERVSAWRDKKGGEVGSAPCREREQAPGIDGGRQRHRYVL